MNDMGAARRWAAIAAALLVALAASGCSLPARLAAVPHGVKVSKPFEGLPDDVRAPVDDRDTAVLARIGLAALTREEEHRRKNGLSGPLPPAEFLAISGGGDNGAYGAGLLRGWAEAGTRPEFKIVTGVSTGALTAPFAFLGSKYDHVLEEVYTKISTKDVLTPRNFLAALMSDAMADSAPLYAMIQRLATPELLKEIAHEYTEKGRMLFVMSTNLDAQRGVIWNMGAIAASGHPRALELFHKVLLASASIPGVFPPVMIDIESGDQRYQEMHVDGGVIGQVILYPPSLAFANLGVDRAGRTTELARKRSLYVIRNARLDPDWATIERQTLKIASTAVSSLIQTQGVGDLYRLYLLADRDNVKFNLAYIPETFAEKAKEPFDPVYMGKLYELGRARGKAGYPWSPYPPGYEPARVRR